MLKIKTQKLIEYGLYLFVFLLPFQTRLFLYKGNLNGGYYEYGTVSLYAIDILLVLVLFLHSFYKFKINNNEPNELKIDIYWWLIAGFELFIFISIFIADDKIITLYKYIQFLLGIGLFWIIVSAEYKKNYLILAFLGGVFLQSVLGTWQFFSQSSFASKWFGIAYHDPADLGVSVIETLNGGRWLRAYGGTDHPNVLGSILVIGLFFLLFLLFKIKQDKQFKIFNFELQNKFKFLTILLKYKLLFLVFIIFITLFFTFSRGAWAGLLLGLIVMLLIAIFKKNLLMQKFLFVFIFTLSLFGGILFYNYKDLVLARLSNDTRLEKKSTTERIESIKIAQKIIKDHWFLGIGIGNYGEEVRNNIIDQQPAFFYQPVHNTYLLIWSEIGILGLFIFLCIFFYIFYLFKTFDFAIEHYFYLGIMISLFIMLLVDHWWWSTHFGVLLFWFVIGVIVKAIQKKSVKIKITNNST
jgi:O-antigen ligase